MREFGLLRTVVATAINEWGVAVDNPLSSFHIKREPDQRLRRVSEEELQQLLHTESVSYTHLRAHETKANLVCRLLLEKKKKKN